MEEYDFTNSAWEFLYNVVDSSEFTDEEEQVIYQSLTSQLKIRAFGDYLRRYIYFKAGLKERFEEVSLKSYQRIIRDSFLENETPASFSETTAKLSALSKNWLTQQNVKRNVVFLLGFGLRMSVEDVNMFLTKALCEQEINPKNPFEVICWYCYKNQYNYLNFEKLWERYHRLKGKKHSIEKFYDGYTLGIRNSMFSIQNNEDLYEYLSAIKENESLSIMSATSRVHFVSLYNEARDLVAKLYNQDEEEKYRKALNEYIDKLSFNTRMSDFEKQKRIEEFRAKKKKVYSRDEITESDIEQVICAAIPKDHHGNLKPGKASKLSRQFSGKRFSRQRINNILQCNTEVTRFDLITLNFFIFSQKLDCYPNPKARYWKFCSSMNEILEHCFLGQMIVQNPYECFILMCILSNEPLSTYANVWELSYQK